MSETERLKAYVRVLETEVADLKALDGHAEWVRLDRVNSDLEAAMEHLRAECDDLVLRCAVLDEALTNKLALETPRTAANDEVRA